MTGESNQGSRWNFRKLVVMGEVAVSLLLLTGAGLLVRTLSKLRDVNPGFNQDDALLVWVDPTLLGYRCDRLATLYNQLPDAIRTIPGVRSVSMSAVPPLSRGQWRTGVFIQGHALGASEDTTVLWNLIGPNYFRTLETPLLQGREFTLLDNATAPKVAIINEAMARFYFGRDSVIGKRLSFVSPEAGEIEIIGVVADAKYDSLREATPHMLFLPYLQTPAGSLPFGVIMEIRTSGNPEALVEAVRQAIRSMDKNIPIMASATLAEVVNRSLAQEQTVAELSSFFSLLALLLAAVGLYGVMTYTVARRTGEIGIRMALGAEQGELLRMVFRESLELVATGLTLGIPLVLVFARAISSQLYGISALDPRSVSIASAVLVSVSAFASYIPARRATKVDPIVALRHE
jgi:macrolide transport system ATP-binding/permease protein